jgi:predicted RecA/RadA family phage recombinase
MSDFAAAPDTDPRLVRLAPEDNICVAATTIAAGTRVRIAGREVAVAVDIPVGHKVAPRAIAAGEHVLKYGASIGSATEAIAAGQHVHTHNLKSDYIPSYARDGQGAFQG